MRPSRLHTTFSLLPDCLAARLPGTLAELEDVVATAERTTSLEAAANAVRRDPIKLPVGVTAVPGPPASGAEPRPHWNKGSPRVVPARGFVNFI